MVREMTRLLAALLVLGSNLPGLILWFFYLVEPAIVGGGWSATLVRAIAGILPGVGLIGMVGAAVGIGKSIENRWFCVAVGAALTLGLFLPVLELAVSLFSSNPAMVRLLPWTPISLFAIWSAAQGVCLFYFAFQVIRGFSFDREMDAPPVE